VIVKSDLHNLVRDFAPYLDVAPPFTTQRLTAAAADRLVNVWCSCLDIDRLTSMEVLRAGLARGIECPIDVDLADWFGCDYYGECASDGEMIRVRVRLDGDWHYREHNEAHELGHVLLFHVTRDRPGVQRRGPKATTIREQNTEILAAALLRRAQRDRARTASGRGQGFVAYLAEMFWEKWLP